MRTRLPLVVPAVLALLGGVVLSAADPTAPTVLPHPDAPTAWACSTQTLEAATDCFLDAETKAATNVDAQAKDNVRVASALAPRLCKPAARVAGEPKPDEELYASCQRAFTAAAEGFCSLDGEAALVDGQGRFALQARGCYAALDEVLRRARMQAALGVRCCRCLEKNCSVARAACAQDIAEGDLDPTALECVSRKRECARACALVVPSTPSAAAPASPASPLLRQRPAHTFYEWL